MKEYARSFYQGKAWIKLSRLYMNSRHYICERCGSAAAICHHKKWITPETINDPSVTLNWDNLECLCRDCHNREHMQKHNKALFDDAGNMIGMKEGKQLDEYRRTVEAFEQAKKCLEN